MLKFKNKPQVTEEDSLAQLRESFNAMQQEGEEIVEEAPVVQWEAPVEATRMVRLKVAQVSGCGCGGATYIDVMRPVPVDSDLQDGDEVDEFDDLDELL